MNRNLHRRVVQILFFVGVFGVTITGSYAGAQNLDSIPCTPGQQAINGFGAITYGPIVRQATPYSATVRSTWDMKLPDGNSIHRFDIARQARDSAGRTHLEMVLNCFSGEDGKPQERIRVSVSDPVANTNLNWLVNDSSPKVVTVTHRAASVPTAPAVPKAEPAPQVQVRRQSQSGVQVERLGSKEIAGVMADGSRSVRTIPIGQEGNELPLEVIEEMWVARDLGLVVLRIRDDPRSGRQEIKVEELSRSEPDAALFTAPADYKVEEVHPNVVTASAQ